MNEAEAEWEIRPFVGAGRVRFGMTRSEVHSILGADFTSFRKTASSTSDTDSYESIAAHLYYDEKDRLEYMEVYEPASVLYGEVNVVGRAVDEALRELQLLGLSPRVDGEAVFFDREGFAFVVVDERVAGVSIFRQGYYDG